MSNNLDGIFAALNASYFQGKQSLIFSIFHGEITNAANNYFQPGQNHADQDRFFNRFTPIWLDLINRRRYFEAIRVWNFALRIASEWENAHTPHKIHKGTPYYFLGVTAILNNELENGFLLMHQALGEDKRSLSSETPPTPAYFFVTLDYSKQAQFFGLKVEQIFKYLSERIIKYRRYRMGSLTIDQFKTRFLECTDLSEEIFLFVFLLFKLRKLISETTDELKQNVFSSLIHARVLFSLCLVIEKAIEHRNPRARRIGARLLFSDELIYLAQGTPVTIDRGILGQLRTDFSGNFRRTINSLVKGRHSLSLSRIERDLSIAYGIRNFGAHELEDQPILYKNMEKLSQRLLNALFFVIERIY